MRLSGPGSRAIAGSILDLGNSHDWKPRQATMARLIDDQQQTIDQAVVTFFGAPKSYTAEDVVEIALHGSPIALRYCVEQAANHGARLAEPGEYTLRAFVNGRIDLPQAEAVRDLIDATTLYQARVAAQQSEGSVSRRIAPVKEQMLELIALLEAGIDFAEDDVDVASDFVIYERLEKVRCGVRQLIDSFIYGKLVHEGFSLAIVGRPNVGKSSLFNRLLEQDRAIVTDIPGTTRDTVSETASLNGLPVRFIDTAGIRAGEDPVEKLGIERSRQAMADADLVLAVIDQSEELNQEDRAILETAQRGRYLLVRNKSDLPARAEPLPGSLAVSAVNGNGLEELRTAILNAIGATEPQETGFITSLRHEQLLQESLDAVDRALVAVGHHMPHEMLLLDLYAALQPIDAITGATTADDILNRIFSTFCIGK